MPIVNIPGIEDDQLKLTGELLADIYLGKITKWNDPKLAELNHGVTLPNLAIAPVLPGRRVGHDLRLGLLSLRGQSRSGSRRSASAPRCAGRPAPAPAAMRASPATVQEHPRRHRLCRERLCHQNKLVTTQLRNKAGQFVDADDGQLHRRGGECRLGSAPDFAAGLIDQPGDTTWPIVSPTFILLPKNPRMPARSRNVMKFFDWAYKNGDSIAPAAGIHPAARRGEGCRPRRLEDRGEGADGKPVWTG